MNLTPWRRKRLVRLHVTEMAPSIEGILIGIWAGHYVLIGAVLVTGQEVPTPLEGTTKVARSRVLFLQEL